MKEKNPKKLQLMLKDLKVEIATIKNNLEPNKKISYPKLLVNQIQNLLSEEVSLTDIYKITGIPVSTLYGWKNDPKKVEKRPLGFKKLKIIKEVESVSLSDRGEITIYLANDIKLVIPLNMMGAMIKILKEEWNVPSN